MDPPWPEKGGGKCKRGADRHYDTMKLGDIAKTILHAPCWLPADDAHLWCWYTDNYLLHALSLVDQLGFRYIRTLQWVKAEFDDKSIRWNLQPFGIGQYLRGEHEGCILAVRGKGRALVQDRGVGSVVLAPKTNKHSEKPAAAYTKFERVSPGPRLEMFARTPRHGWDVWGNEVYP
jgi:N6-adenosine-specific RNA methylase IME4